MLVHKTYLFIFGQIGKRFNRGVDASQANILRKALHRSFIDNRTLLALMKSIINYYYCYYFPVRYSNYFMSHETFILKAITVIPFNATVNRV